MTEEATVIEKKVPKFASFRPKPDSPASSPLRGDLKSSNSRDDGRANAIAFPEDNIRHQHRKHTRREHESNHQRHRRSEDRQGEDNKLQATITHWDEPEIYVVDKVGDTANLKYGSIHSYRIPSYFRVGYGSVLGLSSSLKIDRQLSNEKYIAISDPGKSRYLKRDKAAFAKVGRGRETRVKSTAPASELFEHHDADFLPIDGWRLTKRRRLDDVESGSDSSTEDEQHHYRSIEGKAKRPIVPEDLDIEFNEDISDVGWTMSSTDEVNLRKAALSRKVDSKPSNGDAWLDLINYHEQILVNHSLKQRATAAESLSTADIKLSMYEKALNVVKDPEYSERLIIGMMQEGAKVWDVKKVANKWQIVLQEHPNYINLWTKYLDFQQTNSANFRFDELREAFTRCLGILCGAVAQAEGDVVRHGNLVTIQIYLILRMTICLKEAGFSEQSIAIWQVIFEFNLYNPPGSGNRKSSLLSFEELRTSFEDFWESEVPRIGEEGSVGWETYSSHGGSPSEPKRDKTMPLSGQTSLIRNWHKFENVANLQSQQPARTIDETREDDPYRIVLFSDIKEFVLSLPASSNRTLFSAFLAYCHLPALESTPDSLKLWWQDPFIRNDSLYGFEKLLRSSGSLETTTGTSIPDPFSLPLSSYAVSTDSLFASDDSWFSAFHFQKPKCKGERNPLDYVWIRRVLRTLVDYGIGDNDSAEYFLAFEYNTMPSTARKTAKTLLKKRPSNLRLYNAYALIEFRLGNRSTAESVLAAAINLSRTLDSNAQKETILLWRTWIWELLDPVGTEDALKRILTIPAVDVILEVSDVVTNPAACLRSQKALVDGRDQALSLDEYRCAVLYSECLILLEYLTNERSIESTLSSYEHHLLLFTSRLPPTSLPHELLHQSRAKLLYYHTTHSHSFKPALVRSTLTDSIKRFPHNTIFLSLYAWNEARFRIDDRVRALVHDVVLSSHATKNSNTQDITSHFFAVYTELRRSSTTGSNIHSIRGVFERAVESPCGRQSAAMWKLYFLFECTRGESPRARAVFYRAVRACPWVKELYLLAFEWLGEGMSVDELKAVYEMVVERELRVFVGLEEAFEEVERTE
ncbi:hypothetical protein MMC18_007537 [Xylographa bjoerkii]|nr:hypothetical protein [Xylographa bjoerkii]